MPKKAQRKSSKKNNNIILPDSNKQMRKPVLLKIYADQLPELNTYLNYMSPFLSDGKTPNPYHRPDIAREMKNYLKTKISMIDRNEYKVHAIVHDSDTTDETKDDDGITVWCSSAEKPHAHIIVIQKEDSHPRISQIYKLLGIVWREPKEDKVVDRLIDFIETDELYKQCIADNCTWTNDKDSGKATIHYPDDTILMTHGGVDICCSLSSQAMYLTHDTPDAIKDLKHQYSIDDVITNDPNNYMQLRESYKFEAMPKDWNEIAKLFYDWGYQFKDIDELDSKFDVNIRSKRQYSVAQKEYWKGVKQGISDKPNVTRLCVFIKSPPGFGKSFCVRNYLPRKLGKTYFVDGGNTGKLDNLTVSDKNLVVDDEYIPNMLGMAGDFVTQVYRRGSNNPYFTGETLIILSNDEPEHFFLETAHVPSEQLDAVLDRFYIVEIIQYKKDGTFKNKFKVLKPCLRGTQKQIEEREFRFHELQELFETSMNEMIESAGDMDLLELKKNIEAKYVEEQFHIPGNKEIDINYTKYFKESFKNAEELPFK